MNSKVTILMAVYNAAQHLGKSIGSLMAQTHHNIQIICIDDASTDNSLQILQHYASQDSRITIIHLDTNHGQAYARNTGLKVADGDYVTFLDADDWLCEDAIELSLKVFEQFPDADSVLFNLQYVWENGRIKGYDWHYPTEGLTVSGDGSFEKMDGHSAFMASLNWGIHGVSIDRAWLYNKFPFDATCRFYSDDNTTRLHYLYSREVRCSNGKYFYLQHSSSTTHHIGTDRMLRLPAADSMRQQLIALNIPMEDLNVWEWERWKIIIDCCWFLYLHYKQFTAAERAYCIGAIRKAWSTTDIMRLKGMPIHKFGAYPFKGHWTLFRMQEKIYCMLRYAIGRR